MTARNERLRERQKALGLEPVQTVLHPDDKAALLEYAYQLRVKRGTLTPTDIKRVNDVATVQDPPAPIPTIAQTKIDGVAAVVARFEADIHETSPRWDQAIKLLKELKETLS